MPKPDKRYTTDLTGWKETEKERKEEEEDTS